MIYSYPTCFPGWSVLWGPRNQDVPFLKALKNTAVKITLLKRAKWLIPIDRDAGE